MVRQFASQIFFWIQNLAKYKVKSQLNVSNECMRICTVLFLV